MSIPFFIVLCIGGILSILYFLFSVPLLNNIHLKYYLTKNKSMEFSKSRIVATVLVGIIFSLLSIAVTFKILAWPGSFILLIISLFNTTLILITASIRSKNGEGITFYKHLKKRCIILIFIVTFYSILSFLPKKNQQFFFPPSTEHVIESNNQV